MQRHFAVGYLELAWPSRYFLHWGWLLTADEKFLLPPIISEASNNNDECSQSVRSILFSFFVGGSAAGHQLKQSAEYGD